jgi:spermidine/putrescine-binding protein
VERGTPVHMVYPKEGSPAAVNAGPVVSSKTTNPVAALEWVKFVHSDVSMQMAISLKEYNRMPRKGETPNKAWQEFMQAGKIVWVNDFRETTMGKTYNQQILDLYNRVVIQGG